jgi:hypothetical protein
MAFKERDYGHGQVTGRPASHSVGDTLALIQGYLRHRWISVTSGSAVLVAALTGAYTYGSGRPRPFPDSGTVVVSNEFVQGTATAKVELRGDRRNAIVQLLEPEGLEHALTIYIKTGEKRIVPVQPGTWRLRVIEGDTWYGPARLFNDTTHSWISRKTLTFVKHHTTALDLVHAGRLDFQREPNPDPNAGLPKSALDAKPVSKQPK